MKLHRVGLTDGWTIVLADDPEHAVEQVRDGDANDYLIADELDEPEATLHLTQNEIAALTRLVAGEMGREAVDQLRPNYKETLRRLKNDLDGCVWQLAAQKTMLEKAQ